MAAQGSSGLIYVLYGEDDFSKSEFLAGLRTKVGPADLLEANTTVLPGAGLTPGHLREVGSAAPFLAEHRLILVEGLLGQFDAVRWERRPGRSPGAKGLPEEWQSLGKVLASLPATTFLVFLEGSLRPDNPLLQAITSLAQLREFRQLRGADLERWIHQRVKGRGEAITQGAARRLAELVGGNLWALTGEIEKLALYADRQTIDERAVELLVAQSRETSIFRVVDAVFDGQSSAALEQMHRLRQGGSEAGYIITMLARQLRLILLAHELIPQRLPRQELGQRLGLTAEFATRRVEAQARRHTPERISDMYRRLLETDLAIKRGEMEEGLALEALVAGMCEDASVETARPNRSGSR